MSIVTLPLKIFEDTMSKGKLRQFCINNIVRHSRPPACPSNLFGRESQSRAGNQIKNNLRIQEFRNSSIYETCDFFVLCFYRNLPKACPHKAELSSVRPYLPHLHRAKLSFVRTSFRKLSVETQYKKSISFIN